MHAVGKINKQIISEQEEPATTVHDTCFKKQLNDSLPQTTQLYYIELWGFSTSASVLEGEPVLAVEEVSETCRLHRYNAKLETAFASIGTSRTQKPQQEACFQCYQ